MKLQTKKPKIWKRKGKLTKKAKAYLSYKLTIYWRKKKNKEIAKLKEKIKLLEQQLKELQPEEEIKKYQKFIYSIKLIYESPRDSHHDILTECTLTIIAEKEPDKSLIQNIVISHIDEYTEFSIPYTDIVVGLISQEETTEEPAWKIEEVKYSHNLGNITRKNWKFKRTSIK